MAIKTKRTKAAGRIEIEPSSGNIFTDLSLPHPEERLAKAELARVIHALVSEKGWTQRRGAPALGIAASDMSDLMRGKLARFSQERFGRFLNALGMDVHIQVRPLNRPHVPAHPPNLTNHGFLL